MSAVIDVMANPDTSLDYVTVFTQFSSAGKTFNRDHTGAVSKESAILSFATGQVHHVPDVDAFGALLADITNNACQALMLGFIPGTQDGAPFELTSKRDYIDRLGLQHGTRDELPPFAMDAAGNRLAARLKTAVVGSSWCLLDRDITSGMPDWLGELNQSDWIDHVDLLLPGIRDAGKVISASSTGRLVVDGVQQATKNFHVYYQMVDPVDLERVGSAMLINSFDEQLNLGYRKSVGTSGTTVPWSIFDPTTFSRERLCYEAQPVVWGAGLSVAPADIQVFQGGRIDTSYVPSPEGVAQGMQLYQVGEGGGYQTLDGLSLGLDDSVETKDYGWLTIREYRDGFYGKLRCQSFNRSDSVTWNGYLDRHNNGDVLFFDNGSRTKFTIKRDVNEEMQLAGLSGLKMVEQAVVTPVTPDVAVVIGGVPGGVGLAGGKMSIQVQSVLVPDDIADVFMLQPDIEALCLLNYQDTLYYYEDGAYTAAEGKWLNNRITKFIPKCYHMDAKTSMPVKGHAGRHTVNSVVGYIMSMVHEENYRQVIPFYRHGKLSGDQVDASKLIVFRNGSLDIDSGVFRESSPELFALNPLPYDYDPHAEIPVRFMKFLDEIWEDDQASHDLLQEMFGYLVSGETNLQKMFMLIGVRRGGKGVIGRLIKAIIGTHGIAGVTLRGVSEHFGLEGLLDKRVWLIADARVGRHIDQATVVERLLTITGEDTLNAPRKRKTDWSGTLSVRPIIMSNVMPMLYEPSGALLSRMVTLKFSKSFEGREDVHLEKKLMGEISGIVNWALEGLKRLRLSERFTVNAAMEEMKSEFDELSNPLHGFADIQVVFDPTSEALCADVFSSWSSFSQREGLTIGKSKQSFGHILKTVYPNVVKERRMVNGKQNYVYAGLKLVGQVI